LSEYTPYIKSIYIKEIDENGKYTGYGAQVDFDTDRTYRDMACDISLIAPKKKLCNYEDIVKRTMSS